MQIEFAGPSGAGKSTLEQHFLKLLYEDGQDVLSANDLEKRFLSRMVMGHDVPALVYSFLKLINYSGLFFLTVLSCLRYCIIVPMDKYRFLPCYWLTKDMALSACLDRYFPTLSSRTVYLVSEGLVQHTASVDCFVGEESRDYSRRWLRTKRKTNMAIINLTLPEEVGFRRFSGRGVPATWPEGLHDDRLQEAYMNHYNAVTIAVADCKKYGIVVLNVDVSGTLHESLANLSNAYSILRKMI